MEYEKLSALMVLVFSPQKWLVSYKICVATMDKKIEELCPHLMYAFRFVNL
jgi:hypothetical protein